MTVGERNGRDEPGRSDSSSAFPTGRSLFGVVVARMMGMLVGVSGLTTIGLRRYYAETADLPPPMQVCGGTTSRCDAFDHLLQAAGITQEQTVFAGAAVLALVAAVLAVILLRGVETRALPSRPWVDP